MKNHQLEFWVGLFVIFGFLALAFLALKASSMGSISESSRYLVTMDFDNIGGLKPRAPVKSAGVVVGRVQEIQLNNKTYQAIVQLALNTRYHFPKDSSARILTSGILGEQYISLEPGSSEKMLVDGDTIIMTQSALVMENLLGQLLYQKAADASSSALQK